ncbi:MAG: TonB-dependent hemoglobin/transferrin/lactoferrin family receptor [Comamonadaceae bacterium]|nr:MAG: TonB-dependent hemoglobin/transferrin/lactoferrin family receptor [Comamonadaceae bacterium]
MSLVISLAFGAIVSAHAQTAPTPALKDIVISGTRSEQDPDELPMSIDVINAQQIEERQIQDIRDAAADLPNVSVPRSPARFTIGAQTGRDGNSGFNIRGLEGNRVLMLVDGIRQPRAYGFQSETGIGRDYVDVGLVKRIEILRGTVPALYGSDGIAGLVNFITKDPEDYLRNGRTFGGSASAGYSSDRDGTKLGATVAGKVNESFQWLLSANASSGDALKNKGENDAANVNRTTPNPEDASGKSLLGKLVFTPGAGQKHVFTLEHVDTKSDYNLLSNVAVTPVAGTAVRGSSGVTEMKRDRLTWDGRFQTNLAFADDVRTVLSYQKSDANEFFFQQRVQDQRTRNSNYQEEAWQASIQANKLIRMGADSVQKLTYGFDYMTTDIRNLQTNVNAGVRSSEKRFPDTTESSAALFVQDEIIMGKFSVTPGVRFDHYEIDADQAGFIPKAVSLSGSAVSPKLAALFRATDQWSVYANYAAGFKAPSAGQVNAYFQNNVGGFYSTIPNPNLKAEKSKNFEIGARGRMNALSLDVAAFTGRYKDFIEDVALIGGQPGNPANPGVFQSINLNKVKISGFEVKGRYEFGKVGVGELTLPFAYGQAKGTNELTGAPVDSVNPAQLSLGADYTTPVWAARLNVTHYAAKKRDDVASATQFLAPSATTLDLTGQYKISKDLRLNAGIYNMTDKKYWEWGSVRNLATNLSTIDAYTQPGRYFRVSVVKDF